MNFLTLLGYLAMYAYYGLVMAGIYSLFALAIRAVLL